MDVHPCWNMVCTWSPSYGKGWSWWFSGQNFAAGFCGGPTVPKSNVGVAFVYDPNGCGLMSPLKLGFCVSVFTRTNWQSNTWVSSLLRESNHFLSCIHGFHQDTSNISCCEIRMILAWFGCPVIKHGSLRNPELNRHLNLNDKIIEIQQSMFDYWRQCRKKSCHQQSLGD